MKYFQGNELLRGKLRIFVEYRQFCKKIFPSKKLFLVHTFGEQKRSVNQT